MVPFFEVRYLADDKRFSQEADDNEKEIRKYSKTVEITNRLEPQMTALPEAAFPAKTQEFKQRLRMAKA